MNRKERRADKTARWLEKIKDKNKQMAISDHLTYRAKESMSYFPFGVIGIDTAIKFDKSLSAAMIAELKERKI